MISKLATQQEAQTCHVGLIMAGIHMLEEKQKAAGMRVFDEQMALSDLCASPFVEKLGGCFVRPKGFPSDLRNCVTNVLVDGAGSGVQTSDPRLAEIAQWLQDNPTEIVMLVFEVGLPRKGWGSHAKACSKAVAVFQQADPCLLRALLFGQHWGCQRTRSTTLEPNQGPSLAHSKSGPRCNCNFWWRAAVGSTFCGHNCLCDECAGTLESCSPEARLCPLCRRGVEATLDVCSTIKQKARVVCHDSVVETIHSM